MMPNEKTTKIAWICLDMDTKWEKKERHAKKKKKKKKKHQVEDRELVHIGLWMHA